MTTEPQGQYPVCFPPSYMTNELGYHVLFTILSTISTTTTRHTSKMSRPRPSLDRNEYVPEPLSPASAIYPVKAQATRIGHPSPDQKQQTGQGPSRRPCCYRGSDSPHLNITAALQPLCSGFPPCGYKRRGYMVPRGEGDNTSPFALHFQY